MRGIERRLRQAERRAIEAGFTEFDGLSDERITMEMQRFLSIALPCSLDESNPVERIRQRLRNCKPEEFRRVWAAKEARDAARLDALWQAGTDHPGDAWSEEAAASDLEVRLEDFVAAGVSIGPPHAPSSGC